MAISLGIYPKFSDKPLLVYQRDHYCWMIDFYITIYSRYITITYRLQPDDSNPPPSALCHAAACETPRSGLGPRSSRRRPRAARTRTASRGPGSATLSAAPVVTPGKNGEKTMENGDFMEIFMKNYRKIVISWWFNGEDGDFIGIQARKLMIVPMPMKFFTTKKGDL